MEGLPADDDAPEMLVVGSCYGLFLIDARDAADYYLPFRVAAVVGGVLATLVVGLVD